jgi:hypothetical protein
MFQLVTLFSAQGTNNQKNEVRTLEMNRYVIQICKRENPGAHELSHSNTEMTIYYS